jgi:hypothetical protein
MFEKCRNVHCRFWESRSALEFNGSWVFKQAGGTIRAYIGEKKIYKRYARKLRAVSAEAFIVADIPLFGVTFPKEWNWVQRILTNVAFAVNTNSPWV